MCQRRVLRISARVGLWRLCPIAILAPTFQIRHPMVSSLQAQESIRQPMWVDVRVFVPTVSRRWMRQPLYVRSMKRIALQFELYHPINTNHPSEHIYTLTCTPNARPSSTECSDSASTNVTDRMPWLCACGRLAINIGGCSSRPWQFTSQHSGSASSTDA